MFAGHLGVALAATRLAPRVPLGTLALASMALDIVLWGLVLLGIEGVEIPADFARTHQPHFTFPYSHGLAAALAWSGLAAWLVAMRWRGPRTVAWRAAGVVGAVAFSHWLLDVLVHRPEMPLIGPASPHVGLALWNALPAALLLEAGLVLAGLVLFWADPQARKQRAWRRAGLTTLMMLVLAFTLLGMTVAPPPPSAMVMAASSLGTLLLVCALLGWLGRAGSRALPGPWA